MLFKYTNQYAKLHFKLLFSDFLKVVDFERKLCIFYTIVKITPLPMVTNMWRINKYVFDTMLTPHCNKSISCFSLLTVTTVL